MGIDHCSKPIFTRANKKQLDFSTQQQNKSSSQQLGAQKIKLHKTKSKQRTEVI
jgi:hypothetical protein